MAFIAAQLEPDVVLHHLFEEMAREGAWQKLLAGVPRPAPPAEEDETIYGIRTNINAVNEYCNLLTKFIETNHADLLIRKISLMRHENVPFTGSSSIFDKFQVWKA